MKGTFSEKEIAYLKSQRLARIATVSANGDPDVAPVGFTFDGQHLLIGGIEMAVAGHLSREMLEHYSHVRMAAKRGVIEKLAGGLIAPPSVPTDTQPAEIVQ